MIGWTAGERLHTRGYSWTLVGTERGLDCTALHLVREPEPGIPPEARNPRQTLLSPFDRFITTGHVESPTIVRPRQWHNAVRLLAAASHPAGSLRALPFSKIDLLPHQLEPALAVVQLGATRLLIADAVGLGKTIQAGLIAAELATRTRSGRGLILVPAGLRDQWARELARHFGLGCTRADASWLSAMGVERSIGLNPWTLPGLFLASFDFVKRPEVLRPLEDVSWDLVVLDEAHAASANSERRAAAHAIATRARIVVLLTATPPFDRPADYEALCNLGRIDAREPPVLLFRRSQGDVGVRRRRKSTLLVVRPSEAELRMHDLLEEYTARVWRESSRRGDELARLAVVVLRKRALSSAAALALSVRRRIALLVSPEAAELEQMRLPLWEEDALPDEEPDTVLAAPGLANATLERRWLALIAEAAVRASSSETKLRFVRRMLARVREPVIVFTEYRDTLLRLRDVLSDGTRSVRLLHGGMRPAERTGVQQEFNAGVPGGEGSGAKRPVVLLATDAAAEGLNLHERCRTIIHFELPWSTARLEQRAGRVDRLGQHRAVHETALVSATDAERLVLGPLMRRARHARAAGFSWPGLPAALAESQVAELILGNRDLFPEEVAASPEPTRSTLARTASLAAEALEEMNRTRAIRSLLEREVECSPVFRLQRLVGSVIKRRKSALRAGTVLVYSIGLQSRESHVHTEAVALWLPPSSGDHRFGREPERPKASEVRSAIDRWRWSMDPGIADLLSLRVRRAVEHAARIHGVVDRETARRDALLRGARLSAAAQLVQHGLFERRRAAVRSKGTETFLPDHAEATHRSSSIVSVDVRLVAALVVLP